MYYALTWSCRQCKAVYYCVQTGTVLVDPKSIRQCQSRSLNIQSNMLLGNDSCLKDLFRLGSSGGSYYCKPHGESDFEGNAPHSGFYPHSFSFTGGLRTPIAFKSAVLAPYKPAHAGLPDMA